MNGVQVTPLAVNRQRFREAGLWLADGEEYFRGRFLALNASVPPAVAAALGAARSAGQSPNHIGVRVSRSQTHFTLRGETYPRRTQSDTP